MVTFCWIMLFLIIVTLLAYRRASLSVFSIAIFLYLLLVSKFSTLSTVSLVVVWFFFLAPAVMLNIFPLRRKFLTQPIFAIYKKIKPNLSATEKEALDIGTVGWEGELFSGMPEWSKFQAYPVPKLTEEEQAFLDGPVEELCRMTDNWDINHNRFTLPPEMWQFLCEKGFFGIIIPKKFGGKEFSALAHSAIIMKISGRSNAVATVVGVPNSLGPAELLLEYGTEEQKNYYLPRLATGEEVPCFALTSPDAGSDASAMPDKGIVCKGQWQGVETLGIRLQWNKRYITLAPIATLLGLAFKLYDPEGLLGSEKEYGITCALIPTNLPGITIGRRHYPLNCAFPNGPTQGKDVFIPLDWIIGGSKMAGQGWHMLIERLSVGRAITLPGEATGGAKVAAYTSGAYAGVRTQFKVSLTHFEGIEEALARIAGNTYIMDALRVFAVSAVDRGERPAVPSSISKYHTTEMGRQVLNDAMDIHGGKGICMGPKNYLAQAYTEAPIGITVEGANILTRCMMIFGQGAMRCHPYLLKELLAALNPDNQQGLLEFDRAFWGHLGFLISNKARAFWGGLTGGFISIVPGDKNTRRYYQQITRFSAAFAFTADVVILTLGSAFKRRESISGRLADILSMLYMGSALLKHFENHGAPAEDLPLLKWAFQTIFFKLETAFDALFRNLPNPFVAGALRFTVFPLGRHGHLPNDKLSQKVAQLLQNPTGTRARLAEGAFITPVEGNCVGLLDVALRKVLAAEPVEKKLHLAQHDGLFAGLNDTENRLEFAVINNVITAEEKQLLEEANAARQTMIAVDDFAKEELEGRFGK